MKIYYPDTSFLTKRKANNSWYAYLLQGLKEFGEVIISPELAKLSTFEKGDTITVFDIEINGKKQRIFYDWCDFMVDHQDRAKEHNALYFKIQAYKNITPIGQVVTMMEYLNDLEKLRKIKDYNRYPYDVVGIFSSRRGKNGERRIKSCQIVKEIPHCKSLVGMQRRSPIHEIPKELLTPKIKYSDYLVKSAQTKLSLVWAGVGEYNCAFSWRLTECLGIGNAIITHKHNAIYPNHEYFENNCVIIVNPDLSDLQEKIEYYMEHDEEREQIAKNGREYYEKYLTPRAMAKRIIKEVENGR